MDILLGYLHSGMSQVLSFVILLGVLVFVHELGHFLVARMCGVRVEVFSLGFGKKILQYKKGDTNYCLSLIPLGGYVKMFGEQPGDDIAEEDKTHSFTHKTVWQRMAVVLAGPLMNFFFAILIFMVVAVVGENVKAPVIGEVSVESDAFKAGIRAGDRVVKINANSTFSEISNWDQFQEALDNNIESKITLTLVAEKTKEEKTIEVPIQKKKNPNVLSTKSYIGEISGINMMSYASVVAVKENSMAFQAGLRTGDRIAGINEISFVNYRDFIQFLSQDLNGIETLNIKVVRNEIDPKKTQNLEFKIELGKGGFATKPIEQILEKLGLDSTQLYVDKVMPESPAEKAGFIKGDKIVAINKKTMMVWEDILSSIKSYSGEGDLKISIQRGNETKELSLIPQMTQQTTQHGTEEKRYTIGISPYLMFAQPEMVLLKFSSAGDILNRAVNRTWDVTVMTVMSFVKLIQNQISPKNIGGIFSIAQAANETFKMGLTAFLQMMAFISINLFILNLLPIPVLDGGHIVFYIIEIIKGSPLSLKKMEFASRIGMFLLFSLMIFALINDFKRILGFM